MRTRPGTTFLIGLSALLLSVRAAAADPDDVRRARAEELQRIQDVIEELKGSLDLPVRVTALFVPANDLLVSVQPDGDPSTFVMSFQESFFDTLTADEIRTIVAHELGHVWIFTHHPYLQTERLANNVALRVTSRESLEQVYGKVWGSRGMKGDSARFLPPQK